MPSETKPFGVSGSARQMDTSQFSGRCHAKGSIPEEGGDGSGSEVPESQVGSAWLALRVPRLTLADTI